jgi:hypothetical protein
MISGYQLDVGCVNLYILFITGCSSGKNYGALLMPAALHRKSMRQLGSGFFMGSKD